MGFWDSFQAGLYGAMGVDYYAMQTRDELRAIRAESAQERRRLDSEDEAVAASVGPRYMSLLVDLMRSTNACGPLLDAGDLGALREIASQSLRPTQAFAALADDHPGLYRMLGLDVKVEMGADSFSDLMIAVLDGDLVSANSHYRNAVMWFEMVLGKPLATALREIAERESSASGRGSEVVATIASLADLRDKGVISAEEFEAKKTELLSRL